MAAEITCGECGIQFGVPERWIETRKCDHKTFWCPNGHQRAFLGKSKEEKLAEELSRERQRKAQLEDEVKWQRKQREAADRRVSAARGQVTRLKNRAAAGVCPCCNRSFVALARHMATKHPGFTAEEVAQEVTIQ